MKRLRRLWRWWRWLPHGDPRGARSAAFQEYREEYWKNTPPDEMSPAAREIYENSYWRTKIERALDNQETARKLGEDP